MPRRVSSVSKKQRLRLKNYAVVVAEFRSLSPDNLVCHRCLKEKEIRVPLQDNHHIRGKLGSLLCDIRFFMSVCRGCHDWIDANRKLADEQGYLDLTNWNKQP